MNRWLKIVLALAALFIVGVGVQSKAIRTEVIRLWCHYVEDTEYIPVSTIESP